MSHFHKAHPVTAVITIDRKTDRNVELALSALPQHCSVQCTQIWLVHSSNDSPALKRSLALELAKSTFPVQQPVQAPHSSDSQSTDFVFTP
mmetsp:Transcript_5315/g.7821  ORF Transcript_5315/g.7821 Transcript_5315/m.7821 type:complete len:91 (+) Transcript_5315:97-369(+)